MLWRHFLNYLFVCPDTPWYKHNYLCRRWQVLKWYCLRNSQKAHKQILLLPYCMQAEGENMYCPVYGCNSDGQKNTSGIHFFSFPSGKSVSQQNRRKAWIQFCKRKAFKPSSCSRVCSLHFAEDAYEPGHSPQFLERIECDEPFRIRLKSDALPTLNKPLPDISTSKTRTYTERRQRKKVIRYSVKRIFLHKETSEGTFFLS